MAQEKMYKAALEAIDQGQTVRARDLFTRLLRSDSSKADYWLWMSTLVDSQQERIYCLESALRADPDNEAAKRGLIILGARQGGDDVTPIPPIHRNWEKEIEDVVEPPKSAFHRIKNSTVLRLALGLVAILLIAGLIYLGFSGKKSEPEPVVIYKVSPFPTKTEIPSITPTVTRTMAVRTRTPTGIGPTPLWMFLTETYTPVPIYVNTPHPVIEAYRAGIRAFEKSDWAALLEFMDQAIAIDSGSPDLYYYRAEAFRLLKKPKDAVIEYGKALDINPKFAPAYLGLAYAYEAIKPNTNVEGELSYAVDYDPYFLDGYLARAKFRIKNGNPEGALEDLLAAESLLPEHPITFILRAQAYLALGDPIVALEDALHGHELDITLLPAYLTLAHVYLALQDDQQALDNIETYIRYVQDDAEGWAVKAQLAYKMGMIEQALDACSKGTLIDEENAPSWYYCGLIHMQNGDARIAVNDLVAAANLEPLNFDYSLALAKALWVDNRLDTAVLQYKNAEAIASNNSQLALVYYYRAEMYEQAMNLTKASQDWRLLLDLPSDQVPEEWRILAQERWDFINDITPAPSMTNTQEPSFTSTPTQAIKPANTPTLGAPSPTPGN
jgi:tetratricopeptide (TPR) repeat protein